MDLLDLVSDDAAYEVDPAAKHLVPDIVSLVVDHQGVEVLLALALVELVDPTIQEHFLELEVVHLLGQHLVVSFARLIQGQDEPLIEMTKPEVVKGSLLQLGYH